MSAQSKPVVETSAVVETPKVKVGVNPSLVMFDDKLVTTDNLIGYSVNKIAGREVKAINDTIRARFYNLAIGAALHLRNLGGANFDTFDAQIKAEYANNVAIYGKLAKGDITLIMSRKSNGEYIPVTHVDLLGYVTFLDSVSKASMTPAAATSEVLEVEW